MRIENLFQKAITRPINGVVKADELDDFSVWQELDEFVVTRELDRHFRDFFSRYCEAIDNGKDPNVAGKIGVWVSGFFGSGKSHFIKVLSYLLDNEEHSYEGQTKRAVDFFGNKIHDAMLLGDIKRAVASDTDVILFNIDSKADNQAGRDAILAVFLKVLNELQGYSGDHAHIAHMERHLDNNGKFNEFQAAYKDLTGTEWVDERDAYEFHRDEVVEALSKTLGQSKESCEKWIDSAESNFSLTVENFAKWVKEYLDTKGPDHRLVFLSDEVGQFIGTDTHLMLNLQTITEELGTYCKGRAWVVVTSQEDIDAVLGEMQTSRANDFSKIQGRFKTRLSLSSANVDEVIQERLLSKVEEANPELERLFQQKGDILKNQLTFRDIGTTFNQYADPDDFIKNYPFAPYQFRLLQRIFESIRKAGATGLHLAQGERSLLDAFQSAGKAVSNQEVGILVPLYLFYPSIESFLDTAVKRTIDHASENPSLEPFDINLLQVLFLIRYVDEIKGNVDNLATLCINEIDADRLALKKKIEESLHRLEKETLISRSGDTYFFLTNEERDISREIKGVDLSSGEEAKLLGELIFDDVLRGQRKHRYTVNKMDFTFNRLCDMHPVGNRVEGGLVASIITPLADDYEMYKDAKCVMASNEDNGQVLIRLDDNEGLGRELRALLKTDKYLRTKDDGTLPPATKRIHRDLAEENRDRRERLTHLLSDMLVEGGFYVAGQRLEVKASTPLAALDEALEYLIQNTFTKMSFLKYLNENPLKEIQAILRSDDIGQQTLKMEMPESNPQAIDDIRSHIELCTKTSRKMILHDMINSRYANRPYGWADMEVVLLLTRLYASGEIQLMMGGASIPHDKVYESITTPSKWRKITLVQRITAKPEDVRQARHLGKEVFSEMGPDNEDALFSFLTKRLEYWHASLMGYKTLADTGNYPGKQEIESGRSVIKALLALDESNKFLERFNERKDDCLELSDDFHDLEHFYEHQKPTWDKLRQAHERFLLNRMELERDEKASAALQRMGVILKAASPYGMVQEAEGLIKAVSEVNQALVSERRVDALNVIDKHIEAVSQELQVAGNDESLRSSCQNPLEKIRSQTTQQESLAHISQAESEAIRLSDVALNRIEEHLARKVEKASLGEEPPPKVKHRRVVKPSDLVQLNYIENPDDINKFLEALRRELEDALAKGERIEIR